MTDLTKSTVSFPLFIFIFILTLPATYGSFENKCQLIKDGSSHCIVQSSQKLRCVKTYFNPTLYGHSIAAQKSKEAFKIARNIFVDLRSSGVCSLEAAENCELIKDRSQHCIRQEGKNIKCIQTYFNPFQYGQSASIEKSKEGFNDASRLFAELRNDGICNLSPGKKCELKKEKSKHCIKQEGRNIRCMQTYFNPHLYGYDSANQKNKEEFQEIKNIFINLRENGVCDFAPGDKCDLKKEGSKHCIKQGGQNIRCIQTYFNPHIYGYNSADQKGKEGFREISLLFGELGRAGICKSQRRDMVCDIRLDENSNQYILSKEPRRSYLNSEEELYDNIGTFPAEQYEEERHPNLESAVSSLQANVSLGKCTPINPRGDFCKIRQLPGGSIILSKGGEIIDGSCTGAAELNRKRRLLGQAGLCDPFNSNAGNSNPNPITESNIYDGHVTPENIREVEHIGSTEEK